MTDKRKIEVFSASCPACRETIELVKSISCPSCEVTILDMNDDAVWLRAQNLGIGRVPAVVIDGKLAGCCEGSGVEESTFKAAGLGRGS